MNIEEIVRTSMDQMARDLQPSVPNPAAVRARVNRSRRIRSITAVAVAAAVATTAVVAVAELRDGSSGAEPTFVTIGVDPDAVWMVDGVLHIGDQAYAQDKTIVTALVPLESGAVFGAQNGEVVYQPADGAAQVITTGGEANPLGGPAPVGPAADPDSDIVAILRWSTDDERYDLHLFDAGLGQEISGVPIGDGWELPGDPNPFGDNPLAPIYWVGRNDGDYAALIRNGQELWRLDATADGAYSLRLVGDAPLDATLNVVADARADGRLTFTTPNGESVSSVDAVEAGGGLSHDGLYFAGMSADPERSGAIAVVDTGTGDTRYIVPPRGTVATFPSWSRGHTLMFRATDIASQPSGLVVACDVDTLACEIVAQVDDINKTVLPRL